MLNSAFFLRQHELFLILDEGSEEGEIHLQEVPALGCGLGANTQRQLQQLLT